MIDKRLAYSRNGIDRIFSDLLIEEQVSYVSKVLKSSTTTWNHSDSFRFFLDPKFSFSDLQDSIKDQLKGSVIVYSNNKLIYLDDTINKIISEITYNSKSLYATLHYSSWSDTKKNNEQYKKNLMKVIGKYILNGDTFVPIQWFYLSYGDVCHSDIVEVIDEKFCSEAYPYIDDIDKYIDDYLDSNETILLLKGNAGTGKTRFIRHLVYKMLQRNKVDVVGTETIDYLGMDISNFISNSRTKVMYTSDPEIFKTDEVFISYIEGRNQVLILEDMDTLLQSRTQGNTFVNRLLGASDGFITSIRNKIVVSTNLSSVERDIDSALLRPGRCFDVLEFRALEYDEVLKLVSELGLSVDEFEKLVGSDKKERYTLAEVYRIVNQKRVSGYKKRVFGFTK